MAERVFLPRRLGLAAMLSAVGFLLSSCSPYLGAGVGVSDRGVPVMMNCAGAFTEVIALDADSGRVVWSAQTSSEYGAENVEIGVLPGPDWEETSTSTPGPTPTNWKFVVLLNADREPLTLTVAASDLSVGKVVRFESGSRESVDHFENDTCSEGPSRTEAIVLLVAFVVCGVVVNLMCVLPWKRWRARFHRAQ